MTKKEKEVLLRVLHLLKERPYLWDKNNDNYTNQERRCKAYKQLLEVYKNYDENATVKTLKKKLDNMRTNFYTQINKVKASIQNGAGIEDVYVPTLWYFDAFTFLDPSWDSISKFCPPIKKKEYSSSTEDDISRTESSATSEYKPPKKRGKRRNNTLPNKSLETTGQLTATKEDDGEIIAKAIGVQLKHLKKEQLTIARKLISDVIFYASLERLNESSKVVCKKHRPTSSASSDQYEYNQPSSSAYYQCKFRDQQRRQSPLLVTSPSPSPPNGYHSSRATPLSQRHFENIVRPSHTSPLHDIRNIQKVYTNKQRSSKTNILSPETSNFPKNITDMTVFTIDLQQSDTQPNSIILDAEEMQHSITQTKTLDHDVPQKPKTRLKSLPLDYDEPPKPNTRSKTDKLDDDEPPYFNMQADTIILNSVEQHSNNELNSSEQLNLSLESIPQMDSFSEILNEEDNVAF